MYFRQVTEKVVNSRLVAEISVKFLRSCLTTAKNAIIVCTITKARKKRSMLAPTSERVIHRLEDGLVTDRQKVASELR